MEVTWAVIGLSRVASTSFFCGGDSYQEILRGYSWLCTQESLLVVFGGPYVCRGLNTGWPRARQMPSPLYYHSGPCGIQILKDHVVPGTEPGLAMARLYLHLCTVFDPLIVSIEGHAGQCLGVLNHWQCSEATPRDLTKCQGSNPEPHRCWR